jgi:hypothetical protein
VLAKGCCLNTCHSSRSTSTSTKGEAYCAKAFSFGHQPGGLQSSAAAVSLWRPYFLPGRSFGSTAPPGGVFAPKMAGKATLPQLLLSQSFRLQTGICKTGVPARYPPPVRAGTPAHISFAPQRGQFSVFLNPHLEKSCKRHPFATISSLLSDGCQSGRLGTPGERVYRKVPRVRIPPHPPFG